MIFIISNRRITIGRRHLIFALGLLITGLMLGRAGFGPLTVMVLLGFVVILLRFATKPLSRIIARSAYSIRWKFEISLAMVAFLFLLVSLISLASMDFMHKELHTIQDVGAFRPDGVLAAVDDLENTQHGFWADLAPFLSVLGVLMAAALGGALARSVIDPVRRMGQGMRSIASGDFTQPVQVENRDELGELANRINYTARELDKLQEATLTAERDRALRERMTQVTTAQEEERRRISRELHDDLGPSLAALGNRLRACQTIVRTDPQRTEQELGEVAASLKGNVQEIRHLIYDLRPLALDQLGLEEAIKQQVDRFSQETGIQASFNMLWDVALDPIAEVSIYRVIQECLSNVQKHAKASRVEVNLQALNSDLELRVRDNGQGFDPKEATSGAAEQGVGLMSMRERAELLRGRISVQSRPGSGCEVILCIPAKEVEVGVHSSAPGG